MGCSTPEPAGTSRAGPCLALLSACALTGCAAVGYYAQSVTGHLGLMYRARPIETVIAAPDTEPGLAARLRTALDIREFASDALALPANASYRRYVELDRRFVVWNVVATPELSLAPRQWCFPVAGCLSYRGYFSESAAETYAKALEARGWDVTVAGVRAYSTLGWFADPLLSSMVELPEYLLARIVFHELAHQRLYVPGDPELNESFSVVVERAGVDRWIEAAGRADLTERHRIAAGREAAFLALLRGVRRDLDAVYASSRSDAEKRAAKVQRIEGLKARYAALRTGWEDGPTYDAWFERGVNNAAIALVSTYDRWVPALEALLARYGGDLQALYRAGDVLAALSPDERRSRLEALERTARGSLLPGRQRRRCFPNAAFAAGGCRERGMSSDLRRGPELDGMTGISRSSRPPGHPIVAIRGTASGLAEIAGARGRVLPPAHGARTSGLAEIAGARGTTYAWTRAL